MKSSYTMLGLNERNMIIGNEYDQEMLQSQTNPWYQEEEALKDTRAKSKIRTIQVKRPKVFMIPWKGFTLTLKETQCFHDFMNVLKLELIS